MTPLILSMFACWALSYDTTTCDQDGFSVSGTPTVGGEERDLSITSVNLEGANSRECLTSVGVNIDLGRDCAIQIEADGRGDEMSAYEADLDDPEGCGLGDDATIASLGDTHVEIDGDILPSEFDGTHCYVGSFRVVLDLVVLDGDTEVPVLGTLDLDGGTVVSGASASCD